MSTSVTWGEPTLERIGADLVKQWQMLNTPKYTFLSVSTQFIYRYIYISVVFHNNTFLLEEKPSAIKLIEVGIILLFDTWL